jgi:hypothetical protein
VTLYFQVPVGTPDSTQLVPDTRPLQAAPMVWRPPSNPSYRLTMYAGTDPPVAKVLAVQLTVTSCDATVAVGFAPTVPDMFFERAEPIPVPVVCQLAKAEPPPKTARAVTKTHSASLNA